MVQIGNDRCAGDEPECLVSILHCYPQELTVADATRGTIPHKSTDAVADLVEAVPKGSVYEWSPLCTMYLRRPPEDARRATAYGCPQGWTWDTWQASSEGMRRKPFTAAAPGVGRTD